MNVLQEDVIYTDRKEREREDPDGCNAGQQAEKRQTLGMAPGAGQLTRGNRAVRDLCVPGNASTEPQPLLFPGVSGGTQPLEGRGTRGPFG